MKFHSQDQESRERDAQGQADVAAEVFNKQVQWDKYMLRLAAAVATKSKDPSTKVGVVITRPDHSVVSTGFNGFARGLSDDSQLYSDRDMKLQRTVHAELNAIMFAREPLDGYTMYSTLYPCAHCALHLVQAGIKRFVSFIPSAEHEERWGKSFVICRALMEEAGVKGLLYQADE